MTFPHDDDDGPTSVAKISGTTTNRYSQYTNQPIHV